MRFVSLLIVVCLGMLLAPGPQSFAGEKDDLATLRAEVADLKARVTHAESWAAKTAGFRPLPSKSIDLKAEARFQHQYPIMGGFEAPKGAAPVAPTSAKLVHCVQYASDGKTVTKEWDEPAPAWLASGGSCPSGSCGNVTAQRMPATIIQAGGCPNGQCPNARR